MSSALTICEISPELLPKLRKFRMRKEKDIAAIVLKIDAEKYLVVEDESYEDTTVEEIVAELPEHLPRFIVLSYVLNHGDGRVSYPLCFIFISPSGTKPELQMLYAGSKSSAVKELGMTKVYELRSTEELTDEFLNDKLSKLT